MDTPLRSTKGKAPGWSVYFFVVTISHGDLECDKESLFGWVQANRPLLRWVPWGSLDFLLILTLCRINLEVSDARGVCSGDAHNSALPRLPPPTASHCGLPKL